jgi:hypothetical protein
LKFLFKIRQLFSAGTHSFSLYVRVQHAQSIPLRCHLARTLAHASISRPVRDFLRANARLPFSAAAFLRPRSLTPPRSRSFGNFSPIKYGIIH